MNTFLQVLGTLDQNARFFFVRHGESTGNVMGRMQGQEDLPLTETGRHQARTTGKWFREQGITVARIFTSPLQRATETAEIIRTENHYPREKRLDSLKELYMGRFSGLTIPEIRERYPEEYSRFTAESWETVPEAEPVSSLISRAMESWETLVREANRGRGSLLIVTHGGFLQWLIKTSFGANLASPLRWNPVIKASNCSIFLFDARSVGKEVYYGQWTLMNYVPGAMPELGEQFHTGSR